MRGPVAQTGNVEGGVHIYSSPAASHEAPWQLPAPPSRLADREVELGLLARAQREALERRRPALAVLVGVGGVGKSVLATRFLHEVAGAFCDGQLYADLAGFGGREPADPAEALDGFLRALGVAPGEIPAGLQARAALFRSRTRGGRLSLLLDNALSAAQVRALLPGEGAHLVVVTTRMRLSGLLTHQARFVEVRPLAEDAAVGLVEDLLADYPARAEPAAVQELVELCGRLPLAVCAAASRLVRRPGHTLGHVVAELSSERRRLARLSRTEDLSVRTVFDTSYRALPAPTARVYHLLGLHPGPEFDAVAAAALAGLGVEEAEDALEDLAAASLLEPAASGRWRFHDLVRLHARDLAHTEETQQRREAALEGLLGYYLDTAMAADLVLNSRRWHLSARFAAIGQRPSPFADRESARGWLEGELANLRAMVRLAHHSARHELAWQLCEALWSLLLLGHHYDAWRETHELGLASARALGDPQAEARMLDVLGDLQVHLGSFEAATTYFQRAWQLWERTGHRRGQATILESLGVVAMATGDPNAAIGYLTRSHRMHQELGDDYGAALQRRHLGEAHHAAGDPHTAIAHFTHTLTHTTAQGASYHRLRALAGISAAQADAGQPERAQASATEALALAQRLGARHEVARAHELLARTARARGDIPAARDHLRQAHATYTALGALRADHTARQLTELDDPLG